MTWQDIEGWFDFSAIYGEAVARCERGGVIVELGAWQGKSTAFMAALLKDLRRDDLRFFTVDAFDCRGDTAYLWMEHQTGGRMFPIFDANLKACGVRDRVFAMIEETSRAASAFADSSVDFVFFDAGHDEASVRADLTAWMPKLKKSGWMAGHDIHLESVRRAVDAVIGAKNYNITGNCWRLP